MLSKAYQLLDDSSPESAAAKKQVLAAAKKAADVVWERGLLTKVGHGLSSLLPVCTESVGNLPVHMGKGLSCIILLSVRLSMPDWHWW